MGYSVKEAFKYNLESKSFSKVLAISENDAKHVSIE